MAYRITYDPAVRNEDLPEIPAKMLIRIRRGIEGRLSLDPLKYGKPLQRNLTGLWKMTVGMYRVVYEIRQGTSVVHVWMIRHRFDVYELAAQRLGRPPGAVQ